MLVVLAAAVGGERPAAAKALPPVGSGVCLYTPDFAPAAQTKSVGTPAWDAPMTGTSVATLHTNVGDLVLSLDAAHAPCAVNSFRYLASKGFFDDTNCHRMLAQRGAGVLQCGDPTGTGHGGPGYEFGDENLGGAPGYSRGEVAMANSGPDTNGSQFFLVFSSSVFRRDYTPFGTITSGLPVLDKVAKDGTTGPQKDVPRTKVTLEKVTVADK